MREEHIQTQDPSNMHWYIKNCLTSSCGMQISYLDIAASGLV